MDPANAKASPLAQPSIRSFFQPKQPSYVAPPQPPVAQAPPGRPTVTPTAPPPPPPPVEAKTTPSTTPVAARGTPALAMPADMPTLPRPPSLPANADIVPVQEHHIAALRRINSLLLPVTYPDAFYARLLSPEASGLFSRAILWSDQPGSEPKVVGGLVCRLEPSPFVDAAGRPRAPPTRHQPRDPAAPPPASARQAIYIQSLALLSPYRSLGLAAAALDGVAGTAALLRARGGPDVATIYAHVWTENADGLRWYAARGFARGGAQPVAGYYFRLRPDTAWVVRRELTDAVSAELAAAAAAGSPAEVPAGDKGRVAAQTPPGATPSPAPSLSYQKARPQTEWNDLPSEMVGGGGGAALSVPGSASSSRSSSAVRKKKERAYPAAAFGK